MKTEFWGIFSIRVIFMEDQILIRPDRSLQLDRQTSKWSLWDVVFHENKSTVFFWELNYVHEM